MVGTWCFTKVRGLRLDVGTSADEHEAVRHTAIMTVNADTNIRIDQTRKVCSPAPDLPTVIRTCA